MAVSDLPLHDVGQSDLAEKTVARGGQTQRHAPVMPARYVAIMLGGVLLLCAGNIARSETLGIVAPIPALVAALACAAGLAMLVVAATPLVLPTWARPWTTRARVLSLAIAGGMVAYMLALAASIAFSVFFVPATQYFPSDVTYFTYVNAELVLHGQNPYTSDQVFWTSMEGPVHVSATPIRRGALAGSLDYPASPRLVQLENQERADPATRHGEFDPRTLHSYPALSFMLYIPFAPLGPQWMLIANVLAGLGLLVWLVRSAPVGARGWTLLVALSVAGIVRYSLVFDTELLCSVFLLASWQLRSRGWWGAVLLGLGCAFKQYCWFFAPYFLVEWVLTDGWRVAARRAGVALGAFLLPNLPFIIANPRAWLTSMLLPMTDPMFPMGSGLVALPIGHLVPFGPTWIYSALELLALVVCLVAFIRWHGWLREAALLLALVPLYFAFRSSPNYFAIASWLALAAVPQVMAQVHRMAGRQRRRASFLFSTAGSVGRGRS